MRFSSVLSSNLSGSVIRDGGELTGNGWSDCNFYGSCCRGAALNLERYDRCCMSCMELEQAELCEIKAVDCGFAGSRWKQVHIEDSLFQSCNFKNLYFAESAVTGTVFRECMFDSVVLEQVRLSGIIFQKCVFLGKTEGFPGGCIFQNCFIDC